MKKVWKFCMAIMILIVISCSQDSATNAVDDLEYAKASAKIDEGTVDVFNPFTGEITGTSVLLRKKDGITANFKTTGLVAGHTYTIWWVIWNKPENCGDFPGACTDADFAIADQVEVEVMYAAGHVVGSNGIGNFSAHLNENDVSGSINALFGLPAAGGLQDAESAEVHLVLRSHGPAIPGKVNAQISSYGGGCTIDLGPFTGMIPSEPGECADILAAVHQL